MIQPIPKEEPQRPGVTGRNCRGLPQPGASPRWQADATPSEGGTAMVQEETILSEAIRRAIRQRASRARSKDELVRAVFDGFRSQQVDLKSVSLDAMKAALIEAARAARRHGGGTLPA